MKIVRKEDRNAVSFGCLKTGEVFKWANDYWIVTSFDAAINLENGDESRFTNAIIVHPVDAELHVSD